MSQPDAIPVPRATWPTALPSPAGSSVGFRKDCTICSRFPGSSASSPASGQNHAAPTTTSATTAGHRQPASVPIQRTGSRRRRRAQYTAAPTATRLSAPAIGA
ncbi:MAG: hypothetical protein R2699_16010 [Acidimicrobiales bacterium]